MTGLIAKLTLSLLVLCVASLAGCGALRTLEATSSEYGRDNNVRPNFGRGAFILDLANRVGLMAWFAESAYR